MWGGSRRGPFYSRVSYFNRTSPVWCWNRLGKPGCKQGEQSGLFVSAIQDGSLGECGSREVVKTGQTLKLL